MDMPIRRIKKIDKGDWLLLPSGRAVQVSKVVGERQPDVSLRYLDDDGVQSTGSFNVSLRWLLANGKKVGS